MYYTDFFGRDIWTKPSVNYKVTKLEDSSKLDVDLPGYTKEDLKVNLENDVLTIEGSNDSRGPIKVTFLLERSVEVGTLSLNLGVLSIALNQIKNTKALEIK